MDMNKAFDLYLGKKKNPKNLISCAALQDDTPGFYQVSRIKFGNWPVSYCTGRQWGSGSFPAVRVVWQSQGDDAGFTALNTGLQDDGATEEKNAL